eukprot:423167_1
MEVMEPANTNTSLLSHSKVTEKKNTRCILIFVVSLILFVVLVIILSLYWTGIIFNKTSVNNITAHDIDILRNELRELIDSTTNLTIGDPRDQNQGKTPRNRPLLASIVRLIFHDCGTSNSSNISDPVICNGCIDIYSEHHAGLYENAIILLEDLFYNETNKWYSKMSRSDFWATTATLSIEYAAELQTNQTINEFLPFNPIAKLPNIPYYFGRIDCHKSKQYSDDFHIDESTFYFHALPDAFLGFNDSYNWFSDRFHFSEREVVALFGAHTLGRASVEFSGYWNEWTIDEQILNNDYYKGLYIDKEFNEFKQIQVLGNKYQWVLGNEFFKQFDNGLYEGTLNLNSDMSLIIEIAPWINTDNGQVNCTAPSMPNNPRLNPCNAQRSEIIDIVEQYALNNSVWINEFAQVWIKMITMGYDHENELRLVRSINTNFNWTD